MKPSSLSALSSLPKTLNPVIPLSRSIRRPDRKMGKRGKSERKGSENPTRTKFHVEDDMDDEVDAFMKQRQIVTLDLDQTVFDQQSHNTVTLEKVKSLEDNEKIGKRKRQNDKVGFQSMKMFKVRTALEKKLKQKDVFKSVTPRTDGPQKHLKPLRKLESYDDNPVKAQGSNQGHASSSSAFKLSQRLAANQHKSKKRAAKLAAKAVTRSRSSFPSCPETVYRKPRLINYQMVKYRQIIIGSLQF